MQLENNLQRNFEMLILNIEKVFINCGVAKQIQKDSMYKVLNDLLKHFSLNDICKDINELDNAIEMQSNAIKASEKDRALQDVAKANIEMDTLFLAKIDNLKVELAKLQKVKSDNPKMQKEAIKNINSVLKEIDLYKKALNGS